MSTDTLKEIRNALTDRQQQLMTRIDSVKRDAALKRSADWSEQAQERQNDEVLAAIGHEATEELKKIGKALERIANDEYTVCSRCGEDINIKRLEAVPYTTLCIACASKE